MIVVGGTTLLNGFVERLNRELLQKTPNVSTIYLRYLIYLVGTARQRELTLSFRRSLSYRNQSIDLQSISMDWFLYDRDLYHEKVKP